MSTAVFLAELHDLRIHLSLCGGGLRVEAKPGTLTSDLQARLKAAKPKLVAFLQARVRARLQDLAAEELLPTTLVHDLDAEELACCEGLPDDTLRAYLRALQRGRVMDGGIVPDGYSQPAKCAGCGPVLLWPGSPPEVNACPWCFRRRAGRPIPHP